MPGKLFFQLKKEKEKWISNGLLVEENNLEEGTGEDGQDTFSD